MSGRTDRQKHILDTLGLGKAPVRGDDIADSLGVTRQVVVHEIALLRAAGIPIVSTPRGYYLEEKTGFLQKSVIAVRHGPEKTRDELCALVDCGLLVENVIVEHPVYGELAGNLHVRSRVDVDQFLVQVERSHAVLLSTLTQGYHLHTVAYQQAGDLKAAVAALRKCQIEVFD